MCLTLALTDPAKMIPNCVHLVAQWHLPLHPFASVQDGQLNMKSYYLRYEVSGDKFCGRIVSGLNPVTYNFSVTCCYFETKDEMSDKFETYIQNVCGRTCFD